ncbi:MAG: hypothetical protein ABFC88_12855 [Thermoguttaceae bacterium]
MPANPHWARWVFASVATFLKDVAEEQKLPALVEGLNDRTKEFEEASDKCEIRVTGPFTRELSRNYFRIELLVNVLFTSRYEEQKNQYAILSAIGAFHEAMDGAIAVYQYGDGPDDDEHALVGCLSPAQGRNDAIRVLHFGQIDPNTRLKQSMVDARYVMEISTHD